MCIFYHLHIYYLPSLCSLYVTDFVESELANWSVSFVFYLVTDLWTMDEVSLSQSLSLYYTSSIGTIGWAALFVCILYFVFICMCLYWLTSSHSHTNIYVHVTCACSFHIFFYHVCMLDVCVYYYFLFLYACLYIYI